MTWVKMDNVAGFVCLETGLVIRISNRVSERRIGLYRDGNPNQAICEWRFTNDQKLENALGQLGINLGVFGMDDFSLESGSDGN